MYSYDWDPETGGLVLNSTPLPFSKEPRPVYYKELDILGFDKYWNYEKDDCYPYMWAEANNYFYRGKLVAKTKGGSVFTAPEINIIEEPEPGNRPLRFVDIPRMVEKNRDLIDKIAQETIKKVYNTYIQYKDKVDVFYVAFSGGKDSLVTLDIVRRALPNNDFKVLFGDTGMEFPDTYRIVEKVKNLCEENNIEFLVAKSDFNPEYTWRQFGPPAQTIRWCCSVHKTAPQINLLRKYTNKPDFSGMAFTGIRGDESASRSEYEGVNFGSKTRGQYSCHPLLEWNSSELFLYIYHRNLMINDAYKKGNSRAGCLVCPLATNKNIFFKEKCYSSCGYPNTTTFNNIILDTTSKELSSTDAIKEFMDIGGWKARRSGRELLFAERYVIDSYEDGIFKIQLYRQQTSWKEWVKTVGLVNYLDDKTFEITYKDKTYLVTYKDKKDYIEFTTIIETNTKTDINFMSEFKIIMRKSAFCICCRVCEANCPYGYITMENNKFHIDDRCVRCKQCQSVAYGCLVANSLRLPKEEKKVKSIDRYGNLGIEYDWVLKYFELKDDFWNSPHSLGKNMVKYLKCILQDSGITEKNKFTAFGEYIDSIGIEKTESWALLLCNLVYSSEFNWWIKNIKIYSSYEPELIMSMLGDDLSKNSKTHIVSAYKNIFISIKQLGTELGLGICDYEEKNNKIYLKSITRTPWQNPDPKVVLYSLYKFAENCGGYYQFTLSRLLNHEIESDGVSPTEIFGIEKDDMKKILNGLAVNYPEYISVSFTLDLDNISLKSDKTSMDVLKLF